MTDAPILSTPVGIFRRVAHNSGLFIISNVLNAALTFALSVVVARGLGQAGFGVWTFSLAWASLLTVLSELGLNTLITREAARVNEQANTLLWGSLILKAMLALFMSGVIWLLPQAESDWAALFGWVVLLAVTGTAYGSFSALFRAFQWITPWVWLNVGGLVLQVLGSAWVIWAQDADSVLPLLWVANAVQAMQLILAFAVWWLWLRPRGGMVRLAWVEIYQLLKRALPFAVAGVFVTLQARSGPLALGYMRGAVEVGWWGAAWRFSEAAKLVPQGVFGAAFPAFAAGEGTSLRRLYQRGLFVFALLAALVLILFARPLLTWTYGPEFAPAVVPLLWLGVGLIPALVNTGMDVYLYAVGDEAFVLKWSAVGLAVQCLMSLPLAWAFGASGVALAIGLGEAVIWWPLHQRMQHHNL